MYKKSLFFLTSFMAAISLCSCDIEYTPYENGQNVSTAVNAENQSADNNAYVTPTENTAVTDNVIYYENEADQQYNADYSDDEVIEWDGSYAENATMPSYLIAADEPEQPTEAQQTWEEPQTTEKQGAFRFVLQKGNNNVSQNEQPAPAIPVQQTVPDCVRIVKYGAEIPVSEEMNSIITDYMRKTDTVTAWKDEISIIPQMEVYFSDGSSLAFDCDGSTIVSYYDGNYRHICISQMFKSYLNGI